MRGGRFLRPVLFPLLGEMHMYCITPFENPVPFDKFIAPCL